MKQLVYRINASDEETSRDGILALASKIGFLALLYRLYEAAEPKKETAREWVARNIPGFSGDDDDDVFVEI
jgi:hypothetical protein